MRFILREPGCYKWPDSADRPSSIAMTSPREKIHQDSSSRNAEESRRCYVLETIELRLLSSPLKIMKEALNFEVLDKHLR